VQQKDRKLIELAGVLLSLPLLTVVTPGLAQQNSLNLIFSISGNVQIKRDGRSSYQPAYIGTLLNPLDRLQLGKGASAKVLCNNLVTWNISSQGEFLGSSGCPSTEKPILIRNGSTRAPTRTLNDPEIPYIITPRDTAVLGSQPTLRWNAVKGATSYQVLLRGAGVNWIANVKQPEVVYSGNQTLQPGFRYRIIVTADNGVSSESDAPTRFTLLSEEDAKRVKAEIIQLQNQPLTDESKALAKAYLYKSNNLNTAAIDLLTGLVKQGSKTTAVYQLLGSLYQEAGLNQLAKEQYETALKLAQAAKNLEAQAIIQASLGAIDIAQDNLQQAFESLQSAQDSYRALGDEQQVQELQQTLNNLKGKLPS